MGLAPLVTGVLPVLLLLAGMMALDCYQLVSRRALALAVLWGALAAALAWVAHQALASAGGVPPDMLRRWVAPVVEEALKLVWIVALIRRGRIGFLVDAAIVGFAVGTGFAVVENLYYAASLADHGVLLWVARGLGTAIMHGGATAIAAVLARDRTERAGNTAIVRFLPGFLAASVLHAIFNQLPFSPLVTAACVVLVVPLALVAVYEISERQTRQWLGTTLDANVELLELIESGEIADTPLGRYLTTLREHFPGPVVADMLCLLEIHAELSMRAKGVMIAREAGVAVAPDPEVTARIRELHHLEHTIGPTGRLTIAPFMADGGRSGWQVRILESLAPAP